MADRLTPLQRSANMSRIRDRDSKPELTVRRLAHGMGYRYRLHMRGLPGKPDLVFSSRRKVIFVHGCFWHRHSGCRFAYSPKSRTDFWSAKFQGTMMRDERVSAALVAGGWDVLVLWECETADANLLSNRIRAFLGDRCTEKPHPCRTLIPSAKS